MKQSKYETEALIMGESKDQMLKGHGTPWIRSIFTTVSTMAGAGVLGLPAAVKMSGWTGIPLLVLVCLMATYTAIILIKCMYAKGDKLKTYQEIGEAAFGKFGYYLTLVFQIATLIAVGILFIILGGTNTKTLLDDWSPRNSVRVEFHFIITSVIVWPFIVGLKTMREISFVAVLGMLATTFTVFVICIYSVIDQVPHPEHSWIEIDSFPYAFSVFCFSFGGHNVFPTIQDSMRTPGNYNKMIYVSFFLILILYIPPCFFGYQYFGTKVENPILKNLVSGVVTQLAIGAITCHIWFTLPIIANPVNLWLEELFKINLSKNEFLFRALSRTALLALQTLVACTLKQFGDVMAIIGASTVSATIFFLPVYFYLKLYWNVVSIYEIAWNFLVLLTATIGSVIGLITAFASLASDLSGTKIELSSVVMNTILGVVSGVAVFAILGSFGYLHHMHTSGGRIIQDE